MKSDQREETMFYKRKCISISCFCLAFSVLLTGVLCIGLSTCSARVTTATLAVGGSILITGAVIAASISYSNMKKNKDIEGGDNQPIWRDPSPSVFLLVRLMIINGYNSNNKTCIRFGKAIWRVCVSMVCDMKHDEALLSVYVLI